MTKAYAAASAGAKLAPFSIDRREPGPRDVAIEILYCGVCHSDLHQARDEWGGGIFPMVPGHEIVGRVTRVGADVKKLAVGDLAGVGCMVDSCGACDACAAHTEQFCERCAYTYNGRELGGAPTYGGYSASIVVDEKFALAIAAGQRLEAVAPLLCAGITTYSPLRQYGCKPGDRVGVVGLGGLGHMAVKLAVAMGAEVTLLSSSPKKAADAARLGAHAFVATSEPDALTKLRGGFDLVLDTVSAPHDYSAYLRTLRVGGTMVLLGVPPSPSPVEAGALINANRRLAGSLIGGTTETQEMLDFCAAKNIVSDVEVIRIDQIDEAYERMLRGDVRYRFVVDLATL